MNMKTNNVDLSEMMRFVEQATADPSLLKKMKRVEGSWGLPRGPRAVQGDSCVSER